MLFKKKTAEQLSREEFERQCREATQEVIARRRKKPTGELHKAPWPHEKISSMKDGTTTTRIRGSVFLWGAIISFIVGVFLVANERYIGGVLILTVFPCLLIYPIIRAFWGGKDGIGAAITTVVVEEFIKKEIIKSIEKKSRNRR
jgi:hypothetical protein